MNQTIIMKFHFAGQVSEEEHDVILVEGDILTLDNDHQFSIITGECLNDNTFMGAKRTLKLPYTKEEV